MGNKLHIISFAIPFPANYGGVIDVFYKLKTLHQKGIKITLHCFKYNREEAKELEKYCEKVYYYDRKMKGAHLLSFLPFIVSSRRSESLIENLLNDDSPILYEGLHTCASINDSRLKERVKILRSHNIEHDYYENLAQVEKRPLKKLYFKSEAKKLRRFEVIAMGAADHILGISQKDSDYLNNKYGKTTKVSAFHAFEEVSVPQETKPFAFYHGNLEVGENNEGALFLVKEVFNHLDYPLIIAGNNPSAELVGCVEKLDNVTLKGNIPSSEINALLREAHINVLPTFQSTGIKLKLLAALFSGNHCIVNPEMVQGTGLEELVCICETASVFKEKVMEYASKSDLDILQRKNVLQNFSNEKALEPLMDLING